MLAGDRPPLPKVARHSFHETGTGSSSSSGSKTSSKRRLAQLSSSVTGSFANSYGSPSVPGSRPRHHSISGTTTQVTASPESAMAKEKEFMANTRILAMSNIIDTFTTTQSKQGFYGKQLMIIGVTAPSPTYAGVSGADLEITVKLHVIDNAWTTCPLLPPSTILHRWEVAHLPYSNGTEAPSELACELVSSEDKEHSWIHSSATTERTGTSPMSSPTYEHPPRPQSTSTTSSDSAQTGSPTTHVAVLANALSFVTNKAGDYLVKLVIHVPLTTTSGCKNIHLSQLPRCRSNFISFSVERPQGSRETNPEEIEFNLHPPVMSPEEAHLNPESDEDALFWQEVQEYIGNEELDKTRDAPSENSDPKATLGESNVVGCFAPTSSLHVSWMPKDMACLVQKVEQDMTVHISGLPDQTKSSSLLKDRKRKDPEDSHPLQDPDDEPIEYEHLEMDDADLVISAEGILTAVVEKQGWKKPFIDLTLEHSTIENGQQSDISLIEITGDSVQDWELMSGKDDSVSLDLDAVARESTEISRNSAMTYRVWFFVGTGGPVTIRVNFCVSQPVTVGYGQDITCSIPRVRVQGATVSTGRVQVSSSNDLLIQRSNTRQIETILADSPLYRDDAMINKRQGTQYQYSSSDYDLSVVVHRYKTLSRIARIERIRVDIGVSASRQPGFARVTLSDVVLPEQDDSYLRIYQLDGAEIWSITVDGEPCSKSVQLLDKKVAGNRTVLVPIPSSPQDVDQLHSIEISYGFDSVDHDFVGGDDNIMDSPTRLLIPGFSLPVGEYIVVANLPRLDRGFDYDEPLGDFEVISSQGTLAQRRTITYGAYMTLGHPKLVIQTQATTSPPPQVFVPPPPLPPPPPVSLEPTEQITRAQGHPNMFAHDPQQPLFSAGPVHLQPSSQRHPQQPLEPQNPQAEATSNESQGTGATASNLSPQIGAPIQQARLSFISHDASSLSSGMMTYYRLWWKQVMAPLAAAALVIMIINVAAFQETGNTGLTLVRFSPWMRPFAAIGKLWRDSSSTFGKDDEAKDMPLEFQERIATVTKSVTFHPVATSVLSPIPDKGLEIRKPEPIPDDDPADEEDGEGSEGAGWKRWVQLFKDIVQGFKS
ncbi:hypothetical protein BG003_008078 [Podila horticola]|nr:hypothetical protein BG003_008078 [Podila horticola]